MDMNNLASTIEELQQEVASLRQKNEEYRRLASFPQSNPNPVFEFDRNGQLIFLNAAAHQILSQLDQTDARVFLPTDFAEMGKAASENEITQSFRETRIEDHIYDESIYYSQDYDTFRIYATDITQRRQIEEELKQSKQDLLQTQEFIEAVTKGNDVIIATIDKNFYYTYFNQAYQEELKRLSGKDIYIGMSMLDTFAHLPEQQKVVEQEWIQVLNGESTNKVLEFGDLNLYRRVYNVLHTPIRDAAGNVIGAGEVAYNITEQVQAQEAFLESEARFRMVLKNAPVTVAAQDKDLRFIWAYNQRTVNPAEVIGKTDTDIFPPDVAAWTTGLKRQVLETGKEIREKGWITSGGQRLYLDMFLEPIRNKDGQITGVGVATVDLTGVMLAEQALRESEERYRSLFEGMTEGFAIHEVIFDESGKPCDYRFLDINPAFERLTGLKRELVIGKTYQEVLPDEGDSWVNIYGNVALTGEPVQFEDYSPSLNKHYEVFAYRYALNQFAAIFLDITKRLQAEEALRRAHEKLEVTVQERTAELSNANLELRTEINERKRIESELLLQTKAVEASRKRFNDVLEILPAYLILLTPDYHISFANRYFRERFGEDNGRHCYEYLFKRNEPCENCETYKALKTNTPLNWEWTGPDKHIYDVFDFPFDDVDGSTLILEMGIDITQRKHAEEELRLLNVYNRSLIEANVDALVTITQDGKIGDVNSVTEAITGYPRDVLIGTDFHGYFTDPKKARAGYEQVFETGIVRDYELEIQHKDGHTTPVVYNASVYRDESGKVAGVFAAARDITERKQAEKQLILLTTALETAANGIILVNEDGTILWSNPAFSQMTGYLREEIVGKNPRLLKSGKQDQEFYRNLWDTIFTGKVWHGEIINRRKDGSLYHEDQTITPVFDQNGEITNFISIRQDITEHKKAEAALRKSEEQYRSLVIATTQIVWQTNASGEVMEDIPMWRSYTGQSVQDLQGQGWINALHPDDRERTAEIWAQAVATKTLYDTEYRIRSHTGEYGYFAVRGVPIKDKDGNISGWIGTCTNITEKKNYENQLLQAEKHAVIGRMVGSVTHEINNPLQTIKNCLYLIRQDTGTDSPNNEPLEMALSETQRLSNLVGQLHQLYRPQAVQTMHTQELLDLIEDFRSLIIPHLKNSNVVWQPSTSLQSCMINCVREQVIEVFLNISMNAIEAMQPSGGILSIDMVYSEDKEQVGVILRDTGPGIQAEVLPHIFEPFITTKGYGLGLGLSICYDIIQKHGGKITVDSQPGQGTMFTIWLPIYLGTIERGE
jgi:nitrogen fixation negative regulator NifL